MRSAATRALTNTAANQHQANSDLQANLQQLSNPPDNHSNPRLAQTDRTRWLREIPGECDLQQTND